MPDKLFIGGIEKSLIYFLYQIGLKLELSIQEILKGRRKSLNHSRN